MYSCDHYGTGPRLADALIAESSRHVEKLSAQHLSPHGICPFLITIAFPSGGYVRGPGYQSLAVPSTTVSFSPGRGVAGFPKRCLWCFVEGFSIMRARETDAHGTAVRFPVMVHTSFFFLTNSNRAVCLFRPCFAFFTSNWCDGLGAFPHNQRRGMQHTRAT